MSTAYNSRKKPKVPKHRKFDAPPLRRLAIHGPAKVIGKIHKKDRERT